MLENSHVNAPVICCQQMRIRNWRREDVAGLKHWLALAGKQSIQSTLVYGGTERQERDVAFFRFPSLPLRLCVRSFYTLAK